MKDWELRADLYRVLDLVLDTGRAVVIERRGRRLRIEPEVEETKLMRLRPDLADLLDEEWEVAANASRAVGWAPGVH